MATPPHSADDMNPHPARFVDLHDDILREIADYLDPRRDEPPLLPPTHECPRPVESTHALPRSTLQTVPPPTFNQLGKGRRDLRAVCRATARAVDRHGIAWKIKTMEDLRSCADLLEDAAECIASVEFAVPWPDEDYNSCATGGSDAVPPPRDVDPESVCISDFLEMICRCLETLHQVRRLSITVLPFAGRQHLRNCAQIRLAMKRIQTKFPRLDRLCTFEISSAEFESCSLCTETIIDVFQDYIPQCDKVKLGATPNLYRHSKFTSRINAQTLYVRTDRLNRGPHALFDSLKLSSISPNVRQLVLHSTQHFINLRCVADTILVEHADPKWSFRRLIEHLRKWEALEELDIRLRIDVPGCHDRWRKYVQSSWWPTGSMERIPGHSCQWFAWEDETGIERPVNHYTARLTGLFPNNSDHQAVEDGQLQVLLELADALPKLKRVCFWDKLPATEFEDERCHMRFPSCWQWNSQTSFRFTWSIDRAEDGTRVYKREDILDGPHPATGQQRFIQPRRW